jgi:hypothetical protein
MPDGSATAHVYRPKFATVVSEGYGFYAFRKDVVAALTAAIVALPLSTTSGPVEQLELISLSERFGPRLRFGFAAKCRVSDRNRRPLTVAHCLNLSLQLRR